MSIILDDLVDSWTPDSIKKEMEKRERVIKILIILILLLAFWVNPVIVVIKGLQ